MTLLLVGLGVLLLACCVYSLYAGPADRAFDALPVDQQRRIMRESWGVPAGTRAQQQPVVTRKPRAVRSRGPKKQTGLVGAEPAKKRSSKKAPAILLVHKRRT